MKYKDINIHWLGHDGFILRNGKVVYIDPIKLSDREYEKTSSAAAEEKADIILITHTHQDHVSIEDIKKILKHGSKIIGPADLLSQTRQIKDGIDVRIMEPGKSIDIDGVRIEAVRAYNTNKPFHPKDENWMGYVVEMNGVRVYHAGDTDLINEMKNVKCDVALLPVSGKFVMTSDEAVRAAQIIKPDMAIPMHWGSLMGSLSDAQRFVEGCKQSGINASILEKE